MADEDTKKDDNKGYDAGDTLQQDPKPAPGADEYREGDTLQLPPDNDK